MPQKGLPLSRRQLLSLPVLLPLASCSVDTSPPPSPSTRQFSSPHATGWTSIAHRVAFIGDSFSFGVGATGFDKRWTTLLCKRFGWTEWNVAVSGRGYISGREDHTSYVDQLAAIQGRTPDAVFISGGWNDIAQQHTVAEVVAAAKSLFEQAHRNLPEARVIVIAPLAPASGPPAQLTKLSRDLAPVAKTVGVDYLDLGMPATGHPEWMSADGLHPNDTGYAALAKLVGDQLEKMV